MTDLQQALVEALHQQQERLAVLCTEPCCDSGLAVVLGGGLAFVLKIAKPTRATPTHLKLSAIAAATYDRC